jgi:hypothetical protein
MTDIGIGFQTTLPTPDLRNGALTDMVAVVPSTAIPVQYHWHVVSGVPADCVVKYAEMNMRLAFAVLTHADAQMSLDKRRSQAIILGAMRTALKAYWKIVVADLSPGEVGRAYVSYRPATDAPAVAEGVTLTWGAATVTAAGTAWGVWTDLTVAEKDVAEAFMLLAIAALPTVGWSIVKTGHHFLSQAGPSARAGFTAVKKQWFTKISATAAAWVRQREDYWEDIAFHKVCHPVLMNVATSLASDRMTKQKLEAIDFGSAAVRLPATAPQLEYAKMVLALLAKVSGVLAVSGGTVDLTRLTNAVAGVYEATETGARAVQVQIANSLAHSKDPLLAIAAGILLHITESGAPSTIASSYGFKRLVAEFPAEVAKGSTLSRSMAVRERQAIADGENIPISITF